MCGCLLKEERKNNNNTKKKEEISSNPWLVSQTRSHDIRAPKAELEQNSKRLTPQ